MDASPQLTPRLDSLSFAGTVAHCLDVLRTAAEVSEGPIERHSARVFFIMEELAVRTALRIDREVAACAAVLHDVGLYDPAGQPRFYLRQGRESAERLIETFSWSADRKKTCLDAIESHHRLTSQWTLGTEIELLRLADLVDASRGIVSIGLDRTWLRLLFHTIERKGLQRDLLRHSIRGAPCVTRGLLGSIANAPRRALPKRP